MKRIFAREEWCLACHLCEYHCANANLPHKEGGNFNAEMARNLKGRAIRPRIRVEEDDRVHFALSCRHCDEPACKKSCISGAISMINGVVCIDRDKCVGCYTCILACPYGTIVPSDDGHAAQKCELCMQNSCGEPACVAHCPNRAIVYEEVLDE
ncbi:MAG: 4Fe-4S binding protein [Oscillospiraceae bacterium]|jgi:carbon-monoxide dehydrogenase iron sulfur subunit|nr:4Fe-4S binding protein [Oscillospiraceae bacterium]